MIEYLWHFIVTLKPGVYPINVCRALVCFDFNLFVHDDYFDGVVRIIVVYLMARLPDDYGVGPCGNL